MRAAVLALLAAVVMVSLLFLLAWATDPTLYPQ